VGKAILRARDHLESDQSTFGEGDHSQAVLDASEEQDEQRYRLQVQGCGVYTAAIRISERPKSAVD